MCSRDGVDDVTGLGSGWNLSMESWDGELVKVQLTEGGAPVKSALGITLGVRQGGG